MKSLSPGSCFNVVDRSTILVPLTSETPSSCRALHSDSRRPVWFLALLVTMALDASPRARPLPIRSAAQGVALTPAWTGESDQLNAFYGYSVATAGDVDGDGYSDVIVGAINYQNGEYEEGRALPLSR